MKLSKNQRQRSFLTVQWVKDLALSQQWLALLLSYGFDPWPGNLYILQVQPEKKPTNQPTKQTNKKQTKKPKKQKKLRQRENFENSKSDSLHTKELL